jgi:hypothetical protein
VAVQTWMWQLIEQDDMAVQMLTWRLTGHDDVTVQMMTGKADVARSNDEVTHGPMRRCHMPPSRRSKRFGGYHQIWCESSKSGEIPLSLANRC